MKKLERSLSLPAVIAIGLGGMLGTGIFVLPGLAATKIGGSLWLAYLVAAICILPAAYSKSELATAMPSSGGAYVFIERAFGPLFGTISGLGLWIALVLKCAFALVGIGAYVLVVLDMDSEAITKSVGLGFLFLVFLLNIVGAKKAGNFQSYAVLVALLVLAALFVLGIQSMDQTTPFFAKLKEEAVELAGYKDFVFAVAFVYLSYSGVTKVAAIAEEIKNPDKNLPLGMILSLFIITTIYVLISFVLTANVGLAELAGNYSPIHTLALDLNVSSYEVSGIHVVGAFIALIAVLTLLSTVNAGVLASSRFPFAMSRDGLLPKFWSQVHKKFLTPINTIAITCVAIALVVLFLDVFEIAKLASAFKVMMFISVNLAVIVLRETSAQWYQPKYKSPLYPWVQIFGILTGFVLLFYLGLTPFLAIGAIFLLGAIIYAFSNKENTRTGVLKKYGHRPALYLFYTKKQQQEIEIKRIEEEDKNLDGSLNPEAGVVVPLLGNEQSAEMLVEIAAAINKKETIQAVNITEVPNQTFLDAFMKDDPKILSLERRISGLSKSKNISVDFEAVVTHELSDTIDQLGSQTNCDWLVMGWNGRAHNGILVSNPIGWLLTNIKSDFALFKDNGVRYINKVLLALRPGRKDKNFLAVAERICAFYGAELTLLHVVSEHTPDDETQAIRKKSLSLVSKIKTTSDVQILKSNNSIETISNQSAGYDLLILGTPQKDNWISVLFGTGKDKFTEKSACSVLRLTMKD
ncbi:amino acid permease [Flavobacteriaceae bacterium]|nr:amino acid permease [Flavobacteriaceae bacterium]MDC1371476.1 amino acid permease [Flavobacteriaceae bacterium]